MVLALLILQGIVVALVSLSKLLALLVLQRLNKLLVLCVLGLELGGVGLVQIVDKLRVLGLQAADLFCLLALELSSLLDMFSLHPTYIGSVLLLLVGQGGVEIVLQTLDLRRILHPLVFEQPVVLVLQLSEPILVNTLHLVKVGSVSRVVLVKLSLRHVSMLLDVSVVARIRFSNRSLVFRGCFIAPFLKVSLSIFQVLGVSLLTLGDFLATLIQTGTVRSLHVGDNAPVRFVQVGKVRLVGALGLLERVLQERQLLGMGGLRLRQVILVMIVVLSQIRRVLLIAGLLVCLHPFERIRVGSVCFLLITDVLVLPQNKLLAKCILLLGLFSDFFSVLLVEPGDLSSVVLPQLGRLLLHVLVELLEVVIFLNQSFLECLVVVSGLGDVRARTMNVGLEPATGRLRLGEGLTVGLAVELQVVVDRQLLIQANENVFVVLEVLEKLCLLVLIRAHLVAAVFVGCGRGATNHCLGLRS